MFYQYSHSGSPDYLKMERDKNFSFPPHLHQCFEIVVVCSGQMTVNVDDKSFVLEEKEAVLIFPNQIHSFESTKSEHFLCIFSPLFVQAYTSKVSDKVPVNNKFIPEEYLRKALEQLDSESSYVYKKGILYALCGQFDKTALYDKKQFKNENLLHKIFLFVDKNFNKDCSLARLSKETGYDYCYLSRYFKKNTGLSFNDYVNQFRIGHACYLMENTDLTVLQTAFESGFTSLRNFNRSFKEHLRITPTQYLKKIKSE